jgi:hypothetical protein
MGFHWEDVIDEPTRRYMAEHTAVDLEQKTRSLLAEELPMYRKLIRTLRELIDDKALADRCVNATFDFVSSQPTDSTKIAAYYTGAERGARIGAQRAEEMILEAQEFAGTYTRIFLGGDDNVD